MKFSFQIDSDNVAIQDCQAVAVLLRKVADRIDDGIECDDAGILRDENGNKVGNWSIDPEGE